MGSHDTFLLDNRSQVGHFALQEIVDNVWRFFIVTVGEGIC